MKGLRMLLKGMPHCVKQNARTSGRPSGRRARHAGRCLAAALVLAGVLTAGSGPASPEAVRANVRTSGPVARTSGQVDEPMLLEEPASRALLERGRRHLINFRLERAEEVFRALAARPDGAVAAYYYLATLAMLKAMIADDEAHFEAFHDRSGTLEELLDEAPDSRWRTYLEAEMNLQRALVAVKEQEFMKAAWAGRGAYKRFREVSDETSGFYEPYKGLGLLHLSLASMPSAYRRFLRFFGYSGTVEGGVRELKLAAEKSQYNQEEARIYLAIADVLFLDDREGGLERMAALHEAYPKSPLFAHLYGFMLLSNRRAAEAERVLRAVTEQGDDPDVFPIVYADYFLATALFKQNRFGEAARYYRRYLERYEGPALRAAARLMLGQALEMQGQRGEAVRWYRQVEATRVSDTDEAAERLARRLEEAPMTPLERKLLRARNAFDAGKGEEAEVLLSAIYGNEAAGEAARGEAAFYLGRVYHTRGDYSLALPYYRYAYAHPGPPEAGRAPWSLFHMAEIYTERGQTKLARRTFRAAADYDGDFDFHTALEQRVKIALERLDDG